jgi:hypothetical protein
MSIVAFWRGISLRGLSLHVLLLGMLFGWKLTNVAIHYSCLSMKQRTNSGAKGFCHTLDN